MWHHTDYGVRRRNTKRRLSMILTLHTRRLQPLTTDRTGSHEGDTTVELQEQFWRAQRDSDDSMQQVEEPEEKDKRRCGNNRPMDEYT